MHAFSWIGNRRVKRGQFLSQLHLEVLETRTLLAADFGDAPVPYPTLLADNGARHEELGPMLGATRDTEADGTPSAAADGDGVDEDGVTFGTLQVGALGASVTVNVQGGSGLLDAWVDFNGDGTWGGPGEQIFASHAVAEGNNDLTFDVPSWAKDGETFARFRLSSSGALGPKGAAADGEVEDYAVSIAPPFASSALFSTPNTVSSSADGARSVYASDLDQDGDMDVLSASQNDSKIAWYENDGSESFTEHVISTSAMGATSVVTGDVDGDGDVDVISASASDDKIAWYENDGSQGFTEHLISNAVDGPRAVDVADMDGDGDLDVLSASADNKIAWYENDGSEAFTAHALTSDLHGALFVSAADMDGDGDMDIVGGSTHWSFITWFENDGGQNFAPHNVKGVENQYYLNLTIADVDRDGDMDFITVENNTSSDAIWGDLQWYENIGDPRQFTYHSLNPDFDLATFYDVAVSDMDGDGDLDFVTTSQYDNVLNLYENDGSQHFTERSIGVAIGSATLTVADVDGDHDLDVLTAFASDDKIAWYENQTPPTLVANTGLTLIEGTSTGISSAQLAASAVGNTPAQLIFNVVVPPAHGQLEVTKAPGVAITTFTQADIDAGLVLYRHNGSEEPSDAFQFTISDSDGQTLPATSFSIVVAQTNDAPVLDTTLNSALRSTSEDTFPPASTLVADFLAGAVSDPDPSAVQGIAVTAASSYWGTWQFSTDNGKNWSEMDVVSESAARLLPDTARVRFIPKTDFNGTVKLYYRAWDQTEGSAGQTFNVQGHTGGSTAFSAAKESASLTVNPVNDAPVLKLGGTVGYVHDSPPVKLAPNALLTDVDSLNFYQGSLRVRITDGASWTNRLEISGGFSIDANNRLLYGATVIGQRASDGVGRSDLIVNFNAKATPAIVQELVRGIKFKTVNGVLGTRTVLFSVFDGDRGVSAEARKTVMVT